MMTYSNYGFNEECLLDGAGDFKIFMRIVLPLSKPVKDVTNMVTPVFIRAAITVVTAMPIVLLYPFLQKYFVTGLTSGGVKE